MMKETEIKEHYKQIQKNVDCRNLKIAFDLLAEMLRTSRKPEWIDRKNALEQNYRYLLQYAIDGIKDPHQEDIYNNTRSSILSLTDLAYNALMTSISNDFPYIQKRALSKLPFAANEEIEKTLALPEDNENRDSTLSFVFSRLWLKAFYSEREITLIESVIFGDEATVNDKCIIVSALMLSLLLQYDEKKLDLIITICNSTNGAVLNRAFIALLLGCDKYSNRIKLSSHLSSKLEKLALKPWFNEKFATTILLFINGLETEKINKEIKDDIMPNLMKESTILQNDIDLNSLINKTNSFNENPEWEKMKDKWDVSDKIQRFSQLQNSGADVFMGTFSTMKNHVFFTQLCNWFRPFYTQNSWVKKEFNGKQYQLFNFISLNPSICDSDRYSMLFSLSSVPESYMKELEQGLQSQLEQIKDIKGYEVSDDKGYNDKLYVQLYWQNLYRFFKLHPYKSSFEDPYKTSINITRLPFICFISNNVLTSIVESLMKKKFYSLSIPILLYIIENHKADANTLQKIGFCYQKQMMFSEALNYYEKSELINPNNEWLYKAKAYCYTQTSNYKSALEVYQRLTDANQDDLGLTLCVANCHIALKQYALALPLLFKIDYQSPNDKVTRLIIWCAFVTKNYEQAENYSSKITEDKRNSRDWIILGHINWCKNNKVIALDFYEKATKTNKDASETIESIRNDIETLITNGVNKKDIPFVFDKIRYTS